MAEDTPIVPVAAERLSRLRSAVTLASEGAFSDAVRLLDSLPRDELGEVERVVRSLISEYKIAIDQSELSIEEFRLSKLELLQKIDTIQEQREAIQRLSAPIIDVWDDVITVPLTGVLDGGRVQELAERLLARIHQVSTAWVILDLTGTHDIDSLIAEHLVKLASAVRLMGAECLVTGMQASVARTLVSLGMPLEGLRPIASLKEGLKYCLSRGPPQRLGL